MGLISRLKAVFSGRKRKEVVLGLALGSGGAKGMAHLGALKAFEERGISFQIVTGTSIGSIVGALYANGYSSSDMVGVVESINRREFARNIRPFADMEFAEKIIGSYLEGGISDLKLPFAAWATNADTNEGVLLSEGNVAKALTASSAMPPFFRAIEINGKRLYDGAFTNAIPADVCKNMGADLVIGCDLSAYLRSDEEKSRLTRLFGSAISAITPVKTKGDAKTRGYEAADIMLRPNLYDFRPTDVMPEAMNKMFEIGYAEAMAHMTEIEEAIANARKRK